MAKIPQTRNSSASKNVYDVIPDGDYEARIVRFIGLGIQDQPEWKGEKKAPAFKCSIQFELIGVDATGVDGEGKPLEARPACQFKDYFLFPGAKRGGVFDLCKIIDPTIDRVPDDLDWFIDRLDAIVNVQVGSYETKAGGTRNKVVSVGSVPTKYKAGVEASRSEKVGFDPYVESPEMMVQYSRLFKFQRELLENAHDSEYIPFAGKEPLSSEEMGMKVNKTSNQSQQDMTEEDYGATPSNDLPF